MSYWSRRITEEHRLVYAVEEERIVVMATKYHHSGRSGIRAGQNGTGQNGASSGGSGRAGLAVRGGVHYSPGGAIGVAGCTSPRMLAIHGSTAQDVSVFHRCGAMRRHADDTIGRTSPALHTHGVVEIFPSVARGSSATRTIHLNATRRVRGRSYHP
ncbi:hypothetical protein E3O53_01305 [Cryobacterium sp. TMT2-18-3]|uniref:type II toxin-antitoxin system YoeB family toxin n=1 Tax=unclassified Cryobacterium TaxID=2649013 RepID=UPI001069B1D0|nr:hypothetical protein E3O22_12975 [Cryobacterium sp. TMT2-18-2]TFC36294.1 hypothetical protein E3O18_08195 [Cryobacterium sp. TMT2-42-4]TFC68097.1 hypothetical protein E3O53_01305 [Cryobacterium sp. TMT2-18-3]